MLHSVKFLIIHWVAWQTNMSEALTLLHQPMSAGFIVWPKQCPGQYLRRSQKWAAMNSCSWNASFGVNIHKTHRSKQKNHLFCLQAVLLDWGQQLQTSTLTHKVSPCQPQAWFVHTSFSIEIIAHLHLLPFTASHNFPACFCPITWTRGASLAGNSNDISAG